MKGFLYGCIITALLIFGLNFKNGFMADWTYDKVFSSKEKNVEVKDSIDESAVDITIAHSLEEKCGGTAGLSKASLLVQIPMNIQSVELLGSRNWTEAI